MNIPFSKNNVYLRVKDYTVSGESFNLLINEELDLLKTDPQPSLDDLPKYYQSSSYISHTDSRRTWFEKIYYYVKIFALNRKVKLALKYNNGKGSLLDIGAGTGDFVSAAKKKGWNAIGFEPNENARTLALSKGVALISDFKEINDHSIDVITMWHVLEHIPDLNTQILEIKRILHPKGHLIIAVPNFKSYDAKYYKEFWAAFDVPKHIWHFSKTSILQLFQNYSMRIVKILPMWFDSFYVSILSEKNKTNKIRFSKGLYIGFLSNIKGIYTKEFSSHIYIITKIN